MSLVHGALQMLVSVKDNAYWDSVASTGTHRTFSFASLFAPVGLSWIHTLVMRRVLYGALPTGTSNPRRCTACRTVAQQLPRCPLCMTGEVQWGCGSPSCRQCAVYCSKFGAKGHSEDTLVEVVRKRTHARFACPQIDEEAMQDRMMQKAPPRYGRLGTPDGCTPGEPAHGGAPWGSLSSDVGGPVGPRGGGRLPRKHLPPWAPLAFADGHSVGFFRPDARALVLGRPVDPTSP